MRLQSKEKLLLVTNVLLVLGFGIYYAVTSNYEFVAYAGTIALVTGLLFSTLRITGFSIGIVSGITLWSLMHMLGGSLITSDGVLYAYRIIPIFDGGGDFYILKFDQFVHAYLYGVVGLMFLHLIRETTGVNTHRIFVGAVAIFAAAGFSIINEIVEFIAVVQLPETGVGGYHNTVLDMMFNLFALLLRLALN